MWPLIIAFALSAAGSYLSQKDAKRQKQQEWNTHKPEWESREASRVARNQMALSLLKSWGMEGLIPTGDVNRRLTTANPFPDAPQGPGWEGLLGSSLSGAAPYVTAAAGNKNSSFLTSGYGTGTMAPDFDASSNFGPTASAASSPLGTPTTTPTLPVAGGTGGEELRLPGDTSNPEGMTSDWWDQYIASLVSGDKSDKSKSKGW